MNNKKELYKIKYKTASQEILDVMRHENCIETLEKIWESNDISSNKNRGRLSFEIGSVLLGITHPKDFIPNLEKELEVSSEVAKQIARDVNEKIFSQVKDTLIKIHNIGGQNNETSNNESSVSTQEDENSTPPEEFEKKLQDTSSETEDSGEEETKEVQQNTTPDPYRELPK